MTNVHRGRAIVLSLVVVALALPPAAQAATDWSDAGAMATPREFPGAATLPSGKVLVAGGYRSDAVGTYQLASAELYDPATNGWSPAAALATGRMYFTTTALQDGRVLVVGGLGASGELGSAELYDPAANSWSSAGSLTVARDSHTATLLANGKVLVAGGASTRFLASAELYDPASNSWSSAGTMAAARRLNTATLLANGKVLVAGGALSAPDASAELYDPATNGWSDAAPMTTARVGATATRLADGKVLVAGGISSSGVTASAELYDPAANTWAPTGGMATGRSGHTATPLPDGSVLVAGGGSMTQEFVASAEVYVPRANGWLSAGAMASRRADHSAAALRDGRVLVAGGVGETSYLASAELYTPTPDLMQLSLSGPSANVQDAVAATVIGALAQPGYVDVFAEEGATGCAATSAAEKARPNAHPLGTIALAAGGFSQTLPVPSAVPGTFRVCAFLYRSADDGSGPPSLLRDASVALVVPRMDLTLSPATAATGASVAAQVSGVVGRPAYVDVYAEKDATSCSPAGSVERTRPAVVALGTIALAAGAFSQSRPVPSAALGTYRVCAYLYDVGAFDYDPPRFLRAATLTVKPPSLDLTLSPASAAAGDVVTASVAGEVGQPAYLDLYAVDDGTRCAPTSAAEDAADGSDYLGTLTFPAGPFSAAVAAVPVSPGIYRICAYLYDADEDDDTPPLAARDAAVDVRSVPPAAVAVSPPPPAPPAAAAVDRTPPGVGLSAAQQRLKDVAAKGFKLTVTSTEAGQVCGSVSVGAVTARACATLGAPGRATLRVRLAAKTVRALRTRLRRHRTVAVQVAATARDAARNVASSRVKTIALRR